MKRLRHFCAVTVLSILLTNIASAEEGVMHPGYVPPPTPRATAGTMHPGSTDNCDNCEVNTHGEEPMIDLATEITLQIIQNMLALF